MSVLALQDMTLGPQSSMFLHDSSCYPISFDEYGSESPDHCHWHGEEDLDLNPGQPAASPGFEPPPLQRPKALRPSLHNAPTHTHIVSRERTPRVAAARRDLYARVNDNAEGASCKPTDDLADQYASYQHHHLDLILSRPDTVTSTSSCSAHTSAANTGESTPQSTNSTAPVAFARRLTHRAPVARNIMHGARDKPFTHLQDSHFKMPIRARRRGNNIDVESVPHQHMTTPKAVHADSAVGKGVGMESKESALGTPSRKKAMTTESTRSNGNVAVSTRSTRNVTNVSKSGKLKRSNDFQKMLNEICSLDVRDLQVVELPISRPSTNGLEPYSAPHRTSVSIPLTMLQTGSGSQENKAALPSGWRELVSTTTGQLYYGNLNHGESSWERPSEVAVVASHVQAIHMPVVRCTAETHEAAGTIVQWEAGQDIQDSIVQWQADSHLQISPEIQDWERVPEMMRLHLHDESIRLDLKCRHDTLRLDLKASLPVAPAGSHDAIVMDLQPESDKTFEHMTLEHQHEAPQVAVTLDPDALAPHQRVAASGAAAARASILHVAATALCLGVCSLVLGLERRWRQTKRFTHFDICAAGPPLAEWSVAMSTGVLLLAILVHLVVLPRLRGDSSCTSPATTAWVYWRVGLVALALIDLSLFLLGNVWVLHTYAASGVGCSTSWTTAHLGYATAVVLMICIYLELIAYALALALVIRCMYHATYHSTSRASQLQEDNPDSTNPANLSLGAAGEKVDGTLVFDDHTPTPRLVSCQPPEVVTKPLSLSQTPPRNPLS